MTSDTGGDDCLSSLPVGVGQAAGRSWPLGATPNDDGVNFAIFSANAEWIDLCLFSDDAAGETARVRLRERDGDIWHIHLSGLQPGARYGYRVHGRYAPLEGHRFNANKLLIDPYARRLDGSLQWSDAVMGYAVGDPRADLSFDGRDSAFAVPKSVVVDPSFDWGDDTPPDRPWSETLILEAHAKGLTMTHPDIPEGVRGTYLGLSSDPILDHLTKLGVTAIELLPVHDFIDDRVLVSRGLRNYWGYQTLAFFAPARRYMSCDAIADFRAMVRRFHRAGIEVFLDVVHNHTCESDELGPTLAFRGLDNASYYRLRDGGRYYVNDTGTGNTLDLTHPAVLRMVMDSLRYWVEQMHVDGFRFDLATVLGREHAEFDREGGFFDAIRQDPVLSRVKLIAEPWDIGPGGYRLGQFPHPFHEWNDRFRDGVRQFWRGDGGLAPRFAKAILGSSEMFENGGRGATTSVNMLTAHDGFTLRDLTSYSQKRNIANGEDNRDGHSDNHSDNLGVEGETADARILGLRARRARNLLATLFLSQGTPMLLGGDEIGNGQGGNNNAYAQDNAVGWLDWSAPDVALTAFVTRLAGIRRDHPVLRQRAFLHGSVRAPGDERDVIWRRADGREPDMRDWQDAGFNCLGLELRSAAGALNESDAAIFAVFNAGEARMLTLPGTVPVWHMLLDSAQPDAVAAPAVSPVQMAAQSVLVFTNTAPSTTGRVS